MHCHKLGTETLQALKGHNCGFWRNLQKSRDMAADEEGKCLTSGEPVSNGHRKCPYK